MKKKIISLLITGTLIMLPSYVYGEEESDEFLPFGFTVQEFIEDFSNFGSFEDISIKDEPTSYSNNTCAMIAENKEGIPVLFSFIMDQENYVLNISISRLDDYEYGDYILPKDLLETALKSTDMHLDPEKLVESFNVDDESKNEVAPGLKFKQISDSGISMNFSNQRLDIQRDCEKPDDYNYIEIISNNATQTTENVFYENEAALESAETYSNVMHMSKKAIYNQLTSEYGGKFSGEAAQYAVDNVKANWNENALISAQNYSDTFHMSKQAIYDQLISEYGGEFLPEEAQYAIDNLEVDWNENALISAKNYANLMSMSLDAIHDQLISEYGGQFTNEEADYAITHIND